MSSDGCGGGGGSGERMKLIRTKLIMGHTHFSFFCLSSALSSFMKDGCKLNRRLKCLPFMLINVGGGGGGATGNGSASPFVFLDYPSVDFQSVK